MHWRQQTSRVPYGSTSNTPASWSRCGSSLTVIPSEPTSAMQHRERLSCTVYHLDSAETTFRLISQALTSLILFLASDDAAFCNGACLPSSG